MKTLNVAFADDSEDSRLLTGDAIADRGHHLTMVSSGTDLLKLFEHGPGAFSVIVSDQNMPGGPDGIDVLCKLRADDRFKNVAMILHTNNSEEMFADRLKNAGILYASKLVHGSITDLLDKLSEDG